MKSAILKSAILDSAILDRKNFTHSFWLNLMMAAILNSAFIVTQIHDGTAILDSDTLDSAILWTKKTSLKTSLSLHSAQINFNLIQTD